MKNVFEALVKAGAKVYASSQLWERGNLVATLPAGSFRVTKNKDYDTHSVCISTLEGMLYVQMKSGVATDKVSYEIYEFAATKDWAEYNIAAGDIKLMAV